MNDAELESVAGVVGDEALPRLPLAGLGLLGELRLRGDEGDLVSGLERSGLVSRDSPGEWRARSSAYYAPRTLGPALVEVRRLLDRAASTPCDATTCHAVPAYVAVDHALNLLARCAAALPSGAATRDLWDALGRVLDVVAQHVVSLLVGDHGAPCAAVEVPAVRPDHALWDVPLRDEVDGDNHVVTLGALLQVPRLDAQVLGVLLGAGTQAPIAGALWRVPWGFVRHSTYDSPRTRAPETIRRGAHGPVVLLDDNVGTGTTLARAAAAVDAEAGPSTTVGRLAVEVHWEKLLRVRAYGHTDRVLDVGDLLVPSPWAFRHHRLLRHLIDEVRRGRGSGPTTMDWARYSASTLRVLESCTSGSERRAVRRALASSERLVGSTSGSGAASALARRCRPLEGGRSDHHIERGRR